MINRKLAFLLMALLTVSCLVVIGFSLGLRNPLLGFSALLGCFIFMGIGFNLKRKWREQP
jgi:Ca2+/Na+ antiporter